MGLDTAEFYFGSTHRFLLWNAPADQVLGMAFNVEAYLGIDFFFEARSFHGPLHPGTQAGEEAHISSEVVPQNILENTCRATNLIGFNRTEACASGRLAVPVCLVPMRQRW